MNLQMSKAQKESESKSDVEFTKLRGELMVLDFQKN